MERTLTDQEQQAFLAAAKMRVAAIPNEIKDLKDAGINGLPCAQLEVELESLQSGIEKMEGCEEVVIHSIN